jgi:putative DNA primase/helicase
VELAHLLVRRWLVGCVCAVMPGFRGFRPQGVLTFQGPQGHGKTSWFRALTPADSGWFAEGLDVDPHDRDSVQRLTSVWIAELGEVDATFKKADVAALKALVTRDVDIYRSAYDRREERIPRRTMLAASVNRIDFLVDETGNRRWWTIPVVSVDWQHGIDAQQLWAQMYVLAQGGEPWWLSSEEQSRLAQTNTNHERDNPLRVEICDTFELADPEGPRHEFMTLLAIGSALPTYKEQSRMPTHQEQVKIAAELRGIGAKMKPRPDHNVWSVRLRK